MSDPIKEIIDTARESWHVAAAFTGALISQSYAGASLGMRALANVLIGFTVSCFTAPLLTYVIIMQWPALLDARDQILGSSHFWLGVLGMQLIPFASWLLDAIKVRK